MNECRICEYYAAVTPAAGICTYHYRSGREKPDVASGHDDLVNANDSCMNFRDRHRKCRYCRHYEKTKTYGLGYCGIIQPAGKVQQKLRVSGSDICDMFDTEYQFADPYRKDDE